MDLIFPDGSRNGRALAGPREDVKPSPKYLDARGDGARSGWASGNTFGGKRVKLVLAEWR